MRTKLWVLWVLVVLLLAACAGGQPQAAQPAAPTVAQSGAPVQPTQQPAAPTVAQSGSPVQPTQQPVNGEDPFRPSDPAAVNLAGGKPQLVEFFAFW